MYLSAITLVHKKIICLTLNGDMNIFLSFEPFKTQVVIEDGFAPSPKKWKKGETNVNCAF